ncbi:MFS transporter [Demequina sp.]|uniref:MFS transporter n=1 Tax=Demequina sp. TaxID=2050685 RepID=UPI0025C0BAA4|nr:MFS transporter [Demequina sp.]
MGLLAGVIVDRMVGANQAATALATVGGPALAGLAVATAGPTAVLWVTAAASALAAGVGLLVSRTAGRPGEAPAGGPRSIGATSSMRRVVGSVRLGWVALVGCPVLVWMTVLGTGSIAVTGALQGLILLAYALEIERQSLARWVLVAFAVGALTGAMAYASLATVRTRRAWFAGGLAGVLGGLAVVAPLDVPVMVVAVVAIMGLAARPVNSAVGAVLADHTPDYVRGRVLSLQSAFSLAGAPLGVLSAGAIAHVGWLRAAAWAGVALWAVLTGFAPWEPSLRKRGDESEAGAHGVSTNPFMRSAEVAQLAGVTPRTLRHCHRIGILPEPSRSANEYREYSPEQVARVIRIRRLDAELAEQIAALTRRRRELEEVRQSRYAPDLDSAIAPFADALTDGLSDALADLVLHEMVVGYEMTPEGDRAEFIRVMEAIWEPSVRARLRATTVCLTEIPDDAPDDQINVFAARIAHFNRNEFP